MAFALINMVVKDEFNGFSGNQSIYDILILIGRYCYLCLTPFKKKKIFQFISWHILVKDTIVPGEKSIDLRGSKSWTNFITSRRARTNVNTAT